jgi:2,4-didehydro-3-deoxy-L-rhamnonate hydrolase
MRIGSIAGRLVLVTDGRAVDVEAASSARFSPDPQAVYERWAEFVEWAKTAGTDGAEDFTEDQLDAPVPRPRQVFAIGLNYVEHAKEGHFDLPTDPVVFTKFQSSIAAPNTDIELPSENTDYEVELVVVIGKPGYRIPVEEGWDHVAGLTIGQDISEREVQRRGPAPQYSLGKSFPNFAPIGPVVVTLDEIADRDAIGVKTELVANGATVVKQDGNTRDLIFSVPELISRLSQSLHLYAGDIIFTGTPSGVGMGKNPPEYLKPGETLVSSIDGIGSIRNRLV